MATQNCVAWDGRFVEKNGLGGIWRHRSVSRRWPGGEANADLATGCIGCSQTENRKSVTVLRTARKESKRLRAVSTVRVLRFWLVSGRCCRKARGTALPLLISCWHARIALTGNSGVKELKIKRKLFRKICDRYAAHPWSEGFGQEKSFFFRWI